VREGGEDGDDKEEQESSEGEDIKVFVGPVGQPIYPLRAQIDLPRRMVVECLQAIISTLIPLTPPPSSAAIIPTDWERIVPVPTSPRQYTDVGIQADLTRRLQGDVVNLMVRAEVCWTGFGQLLGEVSAIKSSLESMSGALELKLAARQSWTREMPGGFQPVVLEGEWSPASDDPLPFWEALEWHDLPHLPHIATHRDHSWLNTLPSSHCELSTNRLQSLSVPYLSLTFITCHYHP